MSSKNKNLPKVSSSKENPINITSTKITHPQNTKSFVSPNTNFKDP